MRLIGNRAAAVGEVDRGHVVRCGAPHVEQSPVFLGVDESVGVAQPFDVVAGIIRTEGSMKNRVRRETSLPMIRCVLIMRLRKLKAVHVLEEGQGIYQCFAFVGMRHQDYHV